MTGKPTIPAQRAELAAEAKRCANSRAIAQHEVMDRLLRIDQLTRRIDELIDAMTSAAP